MKITLRVLVLFLGLQIFQISGATEIPTLPDHLTCFDNNHDALPYLNEKVMDWMIHTPDQTLKRALVVGTFTQYYQHKPKHSHFAIDLDGNNTSDLEVIYNDEFGELPPLKAGMKIIVCGDYITVGPRAKLPSPMKAIIHWIHYNPGDRNNIHKDGFLMVGNQPFGTPPKLR